MAVEPIEPASVDVNTTNHQTLLDRFFSAWKGVESYVTQWLPDHPNKDVILTGIKQNWDNTVGVIKDDLEKARITATTDLTEDAKNLVSDEKPIAESAAATATQAAGETAQDVASAVPDTSTKTTADAVTTGTETPAP